MVPHCLPYRVSRGAATLPHRLPLRSIPPPRFACGASHSRDMGVHGLCGRVPDSAGNVSPWIAASAQTDANLSTHLHRLPTPPPHLRRMRLLPGRGAAFLQITYDARIIHQCLALAALFLLCDIPALRTNIRKVPRWSVYAIEYLARRKYQ